MDLQTQFSDEEAREIVDALERKRRQLDEEIEKFKAEKEREYQLFEQLLKNQYTRKKAPDATPSPHNKWPGPAKDIRSRFGEALARRVSQVRSLGKSDASAAGSSQSDANNRRLEINVDHIGRGLLRNIHSSGSYTPTHDRESEFRGLFTPSYLPLVDPSSNKKSNSSAAATSSSSLSSASTSGAHVHPVYQDHQTLTYERPSRGAISNPGSVTHSPTDSLSPRTQSTPSTLAPSRPSIIYRPNASSATTLVSVLRKPRFKSKTKKHVSIRIDENTIVLPNSSIEDGSSALLSPSKLSPDQHRPMFTIGPDDSSSSSDGEEMIEDISEEEQLPHSDSRSETPISPLDLNDASTVEGRVEIGEDSSSSSRDRVQTWRADVENTASDEGSGVFLMDEDVDAEDEDPTPRIKEDELEQSTSSSGNGSVDVTLGSPAAMSLPINIPRSSFSSSASSS